MIWDPRTVTGPIWSVDQVKGGTSRSQTVPEKTNPLK